MAMGRGCKVFHNILGPKGQLADGQPYALIMEQRNKNEVLLFENYAIVSLRKSISSNACIYVANNHLTLLSILYDNDR